MSIAEIPIVRAIEKRLRQLLQKARRIKESTNVDPPLQAIDFEKDISNISQLDAHVEHLRDLGVEVHTTSNADLVSQPQHAALETAARNIFYSLIASYHIDSPSFVDVWNLLDILQYCANAGQSDGSLALWLIEELLDSQTIDGCRRVFDYLESRREYSIANSTSKNKQMIILRSCNELLRKLSRAEDAVFCGRVFIFLFQSFPLGDKSSVNLRGEFHTDNVTAFDESVAEPENGEDLQQNGGEDAQNSVEHADGEKMETDDEVKEGGVDTQKQEGDKDKIAKDTTEPEMNEGNKTNQEIKATESNDLKEDKKNEKLQEEEVDTDTLYRTFWSLQKVFSNPLRLFEDTANFEQFKQKFELVVKKLKDWPKVLETQGTPRTLGEGKRGVKRKRSSSSSEDDFANNFNPKYLTSRDLFELEMSDLTFQRHILVQGLILIDFLLSLTPKAKQKLTELKAQKAMLYNYTLEEEEMNWAFSMRSVIASYLQSGPDGKFYFRMADTVLARDKNWVRWKVESCPPIERPPAATEIQEESRGDAKRVCRNRPIKAQPMGAIDMSFISDTGNVNTLDKMRDGAKLKGKSAEEYAHEVAGIDLDLEMATDEEKHDLEERRTMMTWRSLRMIAEDKLQMLDKVDEIDGLKGLTEQPAEPQSPEQVVETEQNGDLAVENDVEAQNITENPDGDEQDEEVSMVNGDGIVEQMDTDMKEAQMSTDYDEASKQIDTNLDTSEERVAEDTSIK